MGSGLGQSRGFKWHVISMVAGNSLWKMVARQYPVVQFNSAFSNSNLHFKANLTAYLSSFETYPMPVSSLLPLFLPPLPLFILLHPPTPVFLASGFQLLQAMMSHHSHLPAISKDLLNVSIV